MNKRMTAAQTKPFDLRKILIAVTAALALVDALLFVALVLR